MYLKNELMELTEFLHAGTNSSKSKVNWKFLEWAWLKWAWPVWWGSSKSNCIWRRNRWNKLILCMLIQIHKIKCWSNIFWVGMVKNGCGQSGHGNLKLTVPQKWTNGINWFFSSWYKFRRAKSWFNDFGGGCSQKWPWPFNSWDPKNEVMNWADFLNVDSDPKVFGQSGILLFDL